MTIILAWSIKYSRTERKVHRSNLPSFIGDPGHAKNRTPFVRCSRGAIYPPQKKPSHQTLTHISRYFSKPSPTNDAILKPLRTMTQPTKQRNCSHARHEYGIVRSPIHRITDMGVCGVVISI
ncbi:hypothetical protein TNCV_2105731 [Trichonephila clavipes]|nr:hypothetical protein TNCV_2105731 [Trichonephila clavipes]